MWNELCDECGSENLELVTEDHSHDEKLVEKFDEIVEYHKCQDCSSLIM